MSEDTEHKTSWLGKLANVLTPEPQDKGELVDILKEASVRQLLDPDSYKMIQGVLKVSEMHVRDIMIPRSKMVVIESDMRTQVALPIIIQSAHSRFPVIGESKDQVLGILMAKDLLKTVKDGQVHATIKDLTRDAVFIPESKRLDTLLKDFRTKRYHMAIVVDEYGCVAGLVTIEDVLEQIVGDIEDEYDHSHDSRAIKELGNGQFEVKALTPIDEFNEYFSATFSDEEFDTIGGLVLHRLAHMPKPGEKVRFGGFEFEVLIASNRRIELLRAKAIAP